MKLIDDMKGYTVFIPFKYQLENGIIINGEDVFNELKEIYLSDDYEYKKYKIQKLYDVLSIFTFNILEYDDNYRIIKEPSKSNKKFGHIYYIDDMKDSITIEEGIVKLNYEKFFHNSRII